MISPRLTFTFVGLVSVALSMGGHSIGADEHKAEFFEKRIRPILVQNCYRCHSSDSKKIAGGLLLDSRSAVLKGGHTGPAMKPGDPENSLLIRAVARNGTLKMPPERPLTARQVSDLRHWVKTGAFDPRTRTLAEKRTEYATSEHWSFQTLRQPGLPVIQNKVGSSIDYGQWSVNPIDLFIVARQQVIGLEPKSRASDRTLIRRLYFDLIGLPPTREQIEAFLNDSSPHRIETIADELLASPAFGERWGRHWLDVARYAESSGGGRTLLFKDAWRYRDYAIRSFNADKPFDEFIREQIAGDLMTATTPGQRADQLIGPGFLVLGPINYELQDKELLRMEVVDEQIETMGRAFMALTVGCARCHDHKFDPIPTRDYYALAGIFRSTKSLTPGNVSGYETQELPISAEHRAAIDEYDAKLALLDADLKKQESQLAAFKKRAHPLVALLSEPDKLPGTVLDDERAELVGDWTRSVSQKPYVAAGYIHDANEHKGEKKVTFEVSLPTDRYEVRFGYTASTNRASNVRVRIHHADGTADQTVNQKVSGPLIKTFVSLGTYKFAMAAPARIEVLTDGTDGFVVVDAVHFLSSADLNAEKKLLIDQPKAAGDPVKIRTLEQDVAGRRKAIQRLKRDAPPPVPIAMSVKDEKETADYFVCIRGSVHNLGDKVPRGALSVLAQNKTSLEAQTLKISEQESGRLQLANWLSSSSNPLPARVITNRIWGHLFGTGLVRSVDNFGRVGEAPSHPELLDWLAVQFQEDGWSVKRCIRRIVLSETYRQAARAEMDSRDPDNRMLSGMRSRRLDAEAIHDSLVFLSGRLNHRVGGASIRSGTSSEFGYDYGTDRRAVYTPIFRNTLYDLFAVFDFANPNLVTGHRPTSTLPTQSLFMLNSPFVMECSDQIAAIVSSTTSDQSERIIYTYEMVLGRTPTDRELALSRAFVSDESGESDDRWPRFVHALIASIDFRYVH